jgi:hypothetical protein
MNILHCNLHFNMAMRRLGGACALHTAASTTSNSSLRMAAFGRIPRLLVAQGCYTSTAHVVQILGLHVDAAQLIAQRRALDILDLSGLDSVHMGQQKQERQ